MKSTTHARPSRWLRALIIPGVLCLMGHSHADAAGLLIADGGWGGVLEIEEHAVQVTINNGIAVTEVTQVFRNTEDRQVEALYTFPVPKGASVANFSMWINGREMIGEVLEKERAREIYNKYKQRRKDPGLLEQTDYKTFEMRIFPIAAHAEQKVKITYYQELNYDHDWATYVYPLSTTSRHDVRSRTSGRFALALEAKSEVPIVKMESPSHGDAFVIAEHSDSYYQASLETQGGDLNRDVVLAYHLSRPRTGIDVITSEPSGEDGYFCLTLTAGEELSEMNTGMDYVFILDISGSMAHNGKLRLSRDSVGAFIETLASEDRFEVVTFNVQPQTLFNQLSKVNEESQTAAVEFLGSQQARGGTVLRPALSTAYRYADADRTLNVVILSDGMTEQGERTVLLDMISQRPANARVFCIGVGNEVNRSLLEQLAGDAGGLAAFISHGDNFDRQAQAFRRKLMHPVATGLRLDFQGGDVYDVEPRQLPNLYHGTSVRIYGRYRGGDHLKVLLQADVHGAGIRREVDVDLSTVNRQNPEIERMWAWHRIQRLLKEADRGGSRRPVLEEIVRLGEGYSIACEYTSFLVLENDAEFARWKIARRNALRVEQDRLARAELNEELERLRSKTLADLGPVDSTAAPQQINNIQQQQVRQSPSRRRWDIDLTPGGGGAFDPLTVAMVLGLAGLGAFGIRRRR